MACCDSYVSLHRSEGFGLTLAEAMALGKPVIATGYSGNLDFMDADTSHLVDYQLVPVRDGGPFYRGGRWAEPSIAHAAQVMRQVVDRPAEAHALGERARESVGELLSLEAAGRRMSRRLDELLANRAAQGRPVDERFARPSAAAPRASSVPTVLPS